jgi:hypothetical protein
MRILLINPPHPSIGSRIPHEHLPPLGLLSVGGPLIDAGHDVWLLDAEFGPVPTRDIMQKAAAFAPQAVLIGHSGSTSGHPRVAEITRAIRTALPQTWIVLVSIPRITGGGSGGNRRLMSSCGRREKTGPLLSGTRTNAPLSLTWDCLSETGHVRHAARPTHP